MRATASIGSASDPPAASEWESERESGSLERESERERQPQAESERERRRMPDLPIESSGVARRAGGPSRWCGERSGRVRLQGPCVTGRHGLPPHTCQSRCVGKKSW